MRKLFASFVLLCCVSSLHAESLLYTTSFTEWENQTVSGEQMMSYSGIDFAVSYVKIVPNSKPTSVSSYEGTGYIQPSNGSNLSSCYFQTGKLSYVSTVNYTQAAGTAGCGWRLESSSDGVNFYPFNENDAGCTSKNTPEIREASVFMNDVWLRWAPITSGTNTTNIYLLDINIYGEEGGMGTADLQRVYCKMNFQWWTESGAAVGIYAYGDGDITNAAWPGERMVLVDADNGVWTAEVDKSKFTHIIFTRMNPTDDGGSLDWGAQTENLSIPSPDAPVFVMTSSAAAWNESGARVQGYWAAYNEDGNYDTHNVRLTTGFTPEESAAYVYPSSGDYETGSTVSLNAGISTGGWMFDHWSDNGSWDNPRTVTLTQDTTITAVFSPGEYGILINRGRLVRGTYTGRENEHTYVGQFKASVSLQEGDRIQIINLFHSDNSTWRPEIEEGGMSGDFSVDEGLDALMCNQTGCYDIYMKIHYGQSSDYVYIGGGEDCSEGEAVNIDGSGEITEYVYSLVGTAQLFGTAWDVNDSTVLQQEGTNLWSYTLQSVHLNAFQKYEYKVVTNHSWEVGTYPSNSENYSFHVPHTGYYSVHFSFNVTTGASVTETSVIEDESYKDTLVYSNYAVTINGERIVPCVYAGVGDAGLPEYLARVQLQSGEYMEVIDRSNNNAKVGYSMDEYGLSGNFIYKNDSNRYSCSVSGCYDVYYKTDGAVYFGAGSGACSQGLPFDGSVLATGELYLSGPSYISSDSQKGWVKLDGSNNTTTITQRIALGATVTIEAVPNSGYQFLQWSDNNYANPRELVITGDSIIQAEMGSIDLYPVGILLNRKKFVRSTFNDGAQLTVRANIQQGDTVELYYTTSNIYFMAPLEQFGAYTNFTEQSEENRLICNVSGCYDIYFKLQEGITQTIYIGEGTQCFDGVDWTAPAEPDYVYSLVGTANLFGDAWVTQDTTTEMKLQGENMYTYTIDSIALYPDSSYQYKVISNHEWNVKEYPNFEENYTLFVEEPGVYQVLFMLNPDAGCSATTNYLHAVSGGSTGCILASGKCGAEGDSTNVVWSLSCDSVLTISGNGAMADYKTALLVPFGNNYNQKIKSVIVAEGVTTIGKNAFNGCSNIMSIEIPNSVTSLGDSICNSCTSLASIELPDNITSIPIAAFLGCSSLANVKLPNNLTQISTCAFKECTNLVSMEIPNSVTSLRGSVFNGCSNLTSVNLPSDIAIVPAAIFYNCTNLISIEIPDGVTSIETTAFHGCNSLPSVEIPNSVTEIGISAFEKCSSLTNITIPNSVLTIKAAAFRYCSNLETISLPDNLQSIQSSMFTECTNLQSVQIPNDVKSIGNSAFDNCSSLTSIDIPEGVLSIGANAFFGCIGITSLEIPDSVISIGNSAFRGCYNLETITVGTANTIYDSRDGCNAIIETSSGKLIAGCMNTSIPISVKSIGEGAFENYSTLKSIIIPDSVTNIGNSAFLFCSGLESITCKPTTPPTIGSTTFDAGKRSIPVYVPAESIDLYKTTTNWNAFTNIQAIPCEYIASGICGIMGDNVTWSISCDNVLTISGTGAMEEYSGSSSVPWHDYSDMIHKAVITEGVTSLSSSTFENCTTLVSVTIPEGITELGMYTFANCSSLKAVDLPSTITSIGSYCFSECWYIDSIICRATTPPVANGSSLSGVNYMIPIYVPAGTTDQYMDADGWSGFTDYRELTSSCIIASGKCGADADSANVTWVLSCDSVLTISGTGAMRDNDGNGASMPGEGSLEPPFAPTRSNMSAPRKAKMMGVETPWTDHRHAIKIVRIEEGVTHIGDESFSDCQNITEVSLPESLTSIGGYAFANTTKMHSIVIPASVTEIEDGAFNNCTNLDTIYCYNPSPATIYSSTFSTQSTSVLMVPYGSVEQYKAAANWSEFSDIRALACTVASGECGAQGGNVTWSLSCDSIITISGSGAMANYSVNSTGQAPWAEYGLQIRDIVIEEGVTSISAYGFYNAGSYTNGAYNNVRSVSIPSTVKALSNNYFYQCPIQSVAINSDSIVGHTSYSSGSSLHRIFGAQVREYFIGNDVKSIANFAFYNQSPDSVTYITLPDGLQSIGSWAFGYLEHLTYIIVPDMVESIGSDAFAGCEKLESVVLGKNLTSVGAQAFWKDSLLRYVTCNALTPPTLNSTAFDVYGTLNVPCEAKQSYREADYWKQFSLITCGDEMVITFELSSDWTFVMIPGLFGMQPEDVTVNGEVTWATYNGSVRAMGASGWELFDAESVHMCSQALIARAKQGTVTLNIVVPNQARNKQEVYVPVSQHPATYAQNANWCFIGNPYPYSYNITAALDAAGIDSPVTIWNGTGYTTYTPGIDEFTLQPFQPFFIQLSDDAPENILFTPEYITE